MLLSTGFFASNHFPSSRDLRFQTQRLYIGRVVQARSFARRRPSEQGNQTKTVDISFVQTRSFARRRPSKQGDETETVDIFTCSASACTAIG